MEILKIIDLKKNYGSREVVKGLSFSVNEREIFGFLGPNGAGKSTTINILTTALKANSGKIEFMGEDITLNKSKYKAQIGIVPQDLAIFENIPTIDNVKFFASLYGLRKKEVEENVEQVLKMVGLSERKNDLPKNFSGGMKRRLNIACALAHKPKLIILDEPTVGIDPQSRNHILEVIKKLREEGTTIIYTTHYMEEVEAICDRVIILDEGKKLIEGSIEELTNTDIETYSIKVEKIEGFDCKSLEHISGVNKAYIENDILKVMCDQRYKVINDVISEIINQKMSIINITKEEENLEKVFLRLTGKKLRD